MPGVVKVFPVPTCVPPVAASYQRTGSVAEAVRVTVPVPQRCAEVVVGLIGTVDTVAVTATRELGQVPPAWA